MTWPRLPLRTGISYPLQRGQGSPAHNRVARPPWQGTPAGPARPALRPGGDTGNVVSGTRGRSVGRSARSPTRPGAGRAITASRRGNRDEARWPLLSPSPEPRAPRRSAPARPHPGSHSPPPPRPPTSGCRARAPQPPPPGPAPCRPRARHWAARQGGRGGKARARAQWLPTPSLEAATPRAPRGCAKRPEAPRDPRGQEGAGPQPCPRGRPGQRCTGPAGGSAGCAPGGCLPASQSVPLDWPSFPLQL